MRKTRMIAGCRREDGAALLVVLVAVALILAVLLILVIPGYRQHLEDAKITTDAHSVATAKEVAEVTYLQDDKSGLVFYYYDELSHEVYERDEIAKIKPYGRTEKENNLREETGAKGIPNRTVYGGPQLLVIAINETGIVNIRWTGKSWTYQDYLLMNTAERNLLNAEAYREMDRQSMLEAQHLAEKQYQKEYEKLLKKDQDPGTVVYWYDAIHETVMRDKEESSLAPYRMSGGAAAVLKVTVTKEMTEAKWVALKEGGQS